MSLFIFYAGSAHAYTPPANYIYEQFLKKRAVARKTEAKKFEILAKIISTPTQQVFYEVLQVDANVGRVRALYSFAPEGPFFNKPVRTFQKMNELGLLTLGFGRPHFSPTQSILDRIQGRAVWKLDSEDGTLMWIEKDLFTLAGIEKNDFSFLILQPSLPEAANSFPKKIEWFAHHQKKFEYELLNSKINNYSDIKVDASYVIPGQATLIDEWIELVR